MNRVQGVRPGWRWGLALLALVATLLAVTAQAASTTKTVSASGYGGSPQQAISNALVQAVRQAGGVTLAVDPHFRRQVSQWVGHRQGDVSSWVGSSTSEADPQLPTLGGLAGYKVTEVRKVDDHSWRATVQAQVLQAVSVGPDRSALPALVIVPFATRASRYQLGEVSISAAEAQQRLHADLVDAFAQSARFRVLDRANLAMRSDELATLARGSLVPEELIKLGRSAGGDVLLVGSIEDLDIGDNSKSYYGSHIHDYQPRVRIRYRLVDVASGQIVAADLFTWQRSGAQVRTLARQQHIDDWNHPERLADVVYPRIAQAVAAAATQALYPGEQVAQPPQPEAEPQPAGQPMTPGSSDKPIDWGR